MMTIVELVWETDLVTYWLVRLAWYLMFLCVVSEISDYVRDGVFMTLSRTIIAFGCLFIATSAEEHLSHLFAEAVLVLMIGVALSWTAFLFYAVVKPYLSGISTVRKNKYQHWLE